MPDVASPHLPRLKRAAARLSIAAPALAVLALLYRATLYGSLPAGHGDGPGLGPLLDFGLAMLLFAVSLICAAIGVSINLLGTQADRPRAYKTFFIGLGSFLIYELLSPYVPRLI